MDWNELSIHLLTVKKKISKMSKMDRFLIAHHSFPEHKVTSLKSFCCPTNSQNPKIRHLLSYMMKKSSSSSGLRTWSQQEHNIFTDNALKWLINYQYSWWYIFFGSANHLFN